MPETKTQQRRPAASKQAPTRTSKQAPTRKQPPTRKARAADATSTVDRTTELSEDVLKSLDDGARAAFDAMRKFVETVEEALPLRGEGPRRRQEITDSALDMAQRLLDTQYEFLSRVVDNRRERIHRRNERHRSARRHRSQRRRAGKTLAGSDEK